ncbi:MAG TPA: uracil-DNA glycosylase [Burkholderiales bacterium]|nr:uracil-DNA glycosylase [Burkholderiales bacterium]
MSKNLDEFLYKLCLQPSCSTVFNPWRDEDPEWDIPGACQVRREQLTAYFGQRIGVARLILLAEGLSYQGGKFTGIAMTSERILLGKKSDISPDIVFKGLHRQTSIKEGGFNEPTASIVWGTIVNEGVDPYSVVLWNAFPWHPHAAGLSLTNRAPTLNELNQVKPLLMNFRMLFPEAGVIAVGQKAQILLAKMGIECSVVRHPARGGASQFRTQMVALLSQDALRCKKSCEV